MYRIFEFKHQNMNQFVHSLVFGLRTSYIQVITPTNRERERERETYQKVAKVGTERYS